MTPLFGPAPPAAFRLFYERLVSDSTLCQKNFHEISRSTLASVVSSLLETHRVSENGKSLVVGHRRCAVRCVRSHR
jgi:hypothetical protein